MYCLTGKINDCVCDQYFIDIQKLLSYTPYPKRNFLSHYYQTKINAFRKIMIESNRNIQRNHLVDNFQKSET
jgi:hypothetical protein